MPTWPVSTWASARTGRQRLRAAIGCPSSPSITCGPVISCTGKRAAVDPEVEAEVDVEVDPEVKPTWPPQVEFDVEPEADAVLVEGDDVGGDVGGGAAASEGELRAEYLE